MSRKKNMRRLNTLVTSQTLYHLQRLADMDGNRNVGRVVDKLTRRERRAIGRALDKAEQQEVADGKGN